MALVADNARIYGSDDDSVWLAPIGTALPETITETLESPWEDVGWLQTDDGITESATGSKEVIRGHQGNRVVRTRVSESGTTIAFNALEDKAQTRDLRYFVKTVDASTNVRKETRSPGQRVSARAAVIDFYDADNLTIHERWLIPRLEIMPNGDRSYSNADISAYPFIGEIIGDYVVLSTRGEAPTEPESEDEPEEDDF
jgi:hypothetical protein